MTTVLEANDTTLQLQRTFKASIDRVWAAWTDPNQVPRWFGCPDSKGLGATIDLKVGGEYSVSMIAHGQEMTMAGKITELDAPRLLKLEWRWSGAGDFDNMAPTEVTIELAEVKGGTQLTMTHTGFPSVEICNEHQKGWSSSLERIDHFVDSAEVEIFETISEWDAALWDKDLDGLIKDYVAESSLFDIGGQFHGPAAIRGIWEICFPFFEDHIGVVRKDIQITATGDMALMTCLSRCTGMKLPEGVEAPDMMKSWFRTSVVYQKIDGRWKALHEHISIPVNCESGTASYIID